MTRLVFISYSTDDTPVAAQIRDGLETAGIPCWMAPRDITPGKDYGEQIINAIEGATVFLLLLSESSNASIFVRHEVERAVSKGKVIIPFRIQPVQPSRSLEFFISNAQWIDAWPPPLNGHIEALAAAVRSHLDVAAVPPPVTPSQPHHNLPAQTTPFVGRETELAELARLLTDPAIRLVTVVGPGGMGKTRLAIEAAHAQLEKHRHGVCFVPLAPLLAADEIVPAIATALHFSFQTDARTPHHQLLDYLREKELLLVLDNFEHLVDGAALVAEVLQVAPLVKLLVTSRERLRLSGETVYTLEGMTVPDWETPADAETYSAVRLFLQSARLARADFALQPDDLAYVVRICQLVHGLPLGVLLAAAWVEMLSPQEIAEEIAHSLDFLASDLRDLPERQRSLRAVFDYSWRLLSPQEQTVLGQTAVFRGGFTRQAAQQVAGAGLPSLASLVNKSFLQRTAAGRYEVHELVRQYAAEKLQQNPAAAATVRDRHTDHYLAFLRRQAADLSGPRQLAALTEIEADLENVRAAWERAVEQRQAVQVAAALHGLCRFYEWRGRSQDGEALCRSAASLLLAVGDGRGAAGSLTWQAFFTRVFLGQLDVADRLLQQSRELLDGPALDGQDTRAEQAANWLELGNVARELVDRERATQAYEQALALYRAIDDRAHMATTLYRFSYVARQMSAVDSARQVWEQLVRSEAMVRESLAICREIGDRAGLAGGLRTMGLNLAFMVRFDESTAVLEESIDLYTELGLHGGLSAANFNMGWAYLGLGRYKDAEAQFRMALHIAQEIGHRNEAAFQLAHLSLAASCRAEFAEARRLALAADALVDKSDERRWGIARVAGGFAERGLGNLAQAQHHLLDGLRVAAKNRQWLALLIDLSLAALLFLDRGEAERAVELNALLSQYFMGGCIHWLEDMVGKPIGAAAATLAPEMVAAAQTRGQLRSLQTTAEELLVEIAAWT